MKRIKFLILSILCVAHIYAIETDKLKYIGMPVSGICTGRVYLGGDGQLWSWDIFNVSMLDPGDDGGHRFYINPQAQQKRFENGFGLKIKQGDKEYFRALNKNGFSDITFEGEYPIGNVTYNDATLPVSASLKAYSPFIPTDADNSGLPITVLEYTVTNKSTQNIQVEINGWLQNMSCFLTGKGKQGSHINTIESGEDYTRLVCSSSNQDKDKLADWGSMTLTLLENGKGSALANELKGLNFFSAKRKKLEAKSKLGNKLVGSVSKSVTLQKGEKKTFTYLLSWNFPNVHLWNEAHPWKNKENLRHYYYSKFKDAKAVSNYVIKNPWLLSATKDWRNNWYDSSLPKWFLDRTFLNVSTLATNVCVRFDDLTDDPDNEGRFYAMEGLHKGHGTCTHVFHYEQALGRVFPNLARQLREQIDLGLSFKDNGIIGYRGEMSNMGLHDGRGYAIDGHAGTIMRIYREHTMAPDMAFLSNNWHKIKKSIQYMIDHDKEKTGEADGILEGIQYNTLDRIWYGKITWISGLYAASLKAGAQMAYEMKDKAFGKKCTQIAKLAFNNMSEELFDGEYFIQKLDPEHLDAPNSNIGCHTDQLLGQYWASQVGLGYILPKYQVQTALSSIMKYNYVDTYGDYLASAEIPIKRWYADDDEPGVIMCTFPKGGTDKAPGKINNEWEKLVVGYFSEVWTGQEHQLAAALISEGLIEEAFKVEKAVHKRYTPERRNPYNEIEFGNHYTRAMSGYAPFISASGYTYNGPKRVIGFNPKIDADDFKSAFISANGWGSYEQKNSISSQEVKLQLNYGSLKLQQVNLQNISKRKVSKVNVLINNKKVKAHFKIQGEHLSINFNEIELKKDDILFFDLFYK